MSKLDEQKKINAELEREVKLKERAKALDEDRVSLSSGLVDSIKETVGVKSRISTFDNNILKVNKEINKVILDQRKSYSDISSLTKQISKNSDVIARAEKVNLSLSASLSSEGKKRLGYAKGNLTNISKLQKEQDDILKAAEKGEKIDLNRLDAIQKEIGTREATLDQQVAGMSFSERQAFFSEQNLIALKKEQEARKEELKQKEEIEKKLGVFGSLLKGISKIPIVGDLVDTDKILGAARDKVKDTGSGVAGLGAGLKEAGEQMMAALTDPLTIMIAIGSTALENNKKIVDFQRVMGLSKVEAEGLKKELVAAGRASTDMNVTTKALAHTLMSVQEQFGFTANFATETLETATKLEKTVQLSAEAAGALAVTSTLNAGSFEEQYQNALLASREIQIQEERSYSLRGILEDVGKITGVTRAQLGGSVVEITKAVTQAKAFGASLEDVAAAGRSLLEFESSINAELEAELILGKNLNLERARAAALVGDQATVAKELAEQAGTFEEFGKMNVLEQEALAAALGMQSDQLADILFQQEIEGKNAQELRALGKEELANRLEQQNAQEAFNASVEQLKGLFTDVMGFLEPIMSGFTFIVQKVMEFKNLFVALSAIQLAYIGYQKISAALKAKDIALSSKSFFKTLASLVATAAKSVATIPIVGPALAIAAGAAIYSAFKGYEKKDDVMLPGGSSTGYGNRVISGPEGTFALNNRDTIVAGTNLNQGGGGQSINIDNSESKRTNDLLKQVLNKPDPQPTIIMNDQVLGTAVNMGAFSIQ